MSQKDRTEQDSDLHLLNAKLNLFINRSIDRETVARHPIRGIEMSVDHQEILNVWQEYRDGIYEGDADRLAKIFHPGASMFHAVDRKITGTPIASYIDLVRNRDAPSKNNSARDERLVSLAMPSLDSAVLTATILILGKSFTDQLVMMKTDDVWQIVAKTYHLDSVK